MDTITFLSSKHFQIPGTNRFQWPENHIARCVVVPFHGWGLGLSKQRSGAEQPLLPDCGGDLTSVLVLLPP